MGFVPPTGDGYPLSASWKCHNRHNRPSPAVIRELHRARVLEETAEPPEPALGTVPVPRTEKELPVWARPTRRAPRRVVKWSRPPLCSEPQDEILAVG